MRKIKNKFFMYKNFSKKYNNFFITSDLHFFHKSIIEYENRPFTDVEEMNRSLIKNWNDTVSKQDLVFVLGDVSFGSVNKTIEILQKLNGDKILIIGNHDNNLVKSDKFREQFLDVQYYMELKYNDEILILCHYPIANWNYEEKGSIHLFGHLHSMENDVSKFMESKRNNFQIGIDINNFKPSLIEKFVKLSKERKNYE